MQPSGLLVLTEGESGFRSVQHYSTAFLIYGFFFSATVVLAASAGPGDLLVSSVKYISVKSRYIGAAGSWQRAAL